MCWRTKASTIGVPPGTVGRPRQRHPRRNSHRQATDAICEAITKCGALLAQVSPAGSGDNPDELPDTLIQEP